MKPFRCNCPICDLIWKNGLPHYKRNIEPGEFFYVCFACKQRIAFLEKQPKLRLIKGGKYGNQNLG